MTDFTPARLAELRAVAEAATQTEWHIENDSEQDYEAGIRYSEWPSEIVGPENAMPTEWAKTHGETHRVQEVPELKPEDADHIATFDPPTVLALIAALEAKTAALERVKALHECLYSDSTGGPVCAACVDSMYDPDPWPCRTIQAIEGTNA